MLMQRLLDPDGICSGESGECRARMLPRWDGDWCLYDEALVVIQEAQDAILATMDEAFIRGDVAGMEGRPVTTCPYPEESILAHWWTRGYTSAFRQIRAMVAEAKCHPGPGDLFVGPADSLHGIT